MTHVKRDPRVVHLTTVHPRNDVRILIKQARTLAQHGHDVSLVVADGLGDTQDGAIAITDVGAPSNRLHRFFVRGPQAFIAALRIRPTVIHFHDPELLPLAALWSVVSKTLFIYDAHEDLPRQVLSKSYISRWFRPFLSRIVEFTERVLTSRMAAIVTVTPKIRDRFARFHRRVVMVANYPLLREFRAASLAARDSDPAYVCYVGVIAPIRGIHQMVHAMEFVEAVVRLKVAGYHSHESLRTLLAAQPGWSKVDELGFLDRDGLGAVLGAATAGIVTLQPVANYLDAYPIKLFEYMSAGIPVIASDFPLWRSIVEGSKCGICVDPTNPEAIAAAIDFLVANPEKAAEMGQNGRVAVERHYNWEHESRNLLGLYRELIA